MEKSSHFAKVSRRSSAVNVQITTKRRVSAACKVALGATRGSKTKPRVTSVAVRATPMRTALGMRSHRAQPMPMTRAMLMMGPGMARVAAGSMKDSVKRLS